MPEPVTYDPAAPSEMQDPFPGWKWARENTPIFYTPQHDVWWVSRYDDVRAILQEPATFSSVQAFRTPPPPPDLAEAIGGLPWEYTIAAHDRPEHTRLRRLAQVAFLPKHVADREPMIRAIANRYIDAFPKDEPFNLVTAFSQPIPLEVITRIVGAPVEDMPQMRRWTDTVFRLIGSAAMFDEAQRTALYEQIRELMDYCRALIDARRRSPQDDVATDLTHARGEDGEPQLSDAELAGVIISLFTAGNETSASLISQSLYCLLSNPEQWEAVRQDRSLIPAAVEETLRFCGPVKGIQRTARRDVTIGDVDIPKGAQLYLLLGSTGRDEAAWENVDSFEIRRPSLSQHLMLGRGLHFCLGGPLARLEGRVALECICDRVSDIQLEGPIVYGESARVLSPTEMLVRVP
jgi:cytochrome P450